MARVVAYIPDLLFGSQVQGALGAAGHEVELVAGEAALRAKLTRAEALVLDLTDDGAGRVSMVDALEAEGLLAHTRTLAFYSHVDVDTRELARRADLDLVVPRSRMAREGAQLVASLVTRPMLGSR